MKTLLLDVYNEKVEILDVEDPDHNLDIFYDKLDCRCIDIVMRKVGDRWFDIVCDDEGLFHDPQKISAIDKSGLPMLVGNLMFFHHKGSSLTGLDAKDFDILKDNLGLAFTEQFPDGYPAIFNMDWK